MDPYICCLLGICCPPFSEVQRQKLIKMRLERGGCKSQAEAEAAVRFDLALAKSFLDVMKGKS